MRDLKLTELRNSANENKKWRMAGLAAHENSIRHSEFVISLLHTVSLLCLSVAAKC